MIRCPICAGLSANLALEWKKYTTHRISGDQLRRVLQVSMYFTAVAAVDYFYQWWSYEKKIKMSKDEVKEEFKQLEGNPEIKGRIRRIQRQMALNLGRRGLNVTLKRVCVP